MSRTIASVTAAHRDRPAHHSRNAAWLLAVALVALGACGTVDVAPSAKDGAGGNGAAGAGAPDGAAGTGGSFSAAGGAGGAAAAAAGSSGGASSGGAAGSSSSSSAGGSGEAGHPDVTSCPRPISAWGSQCQNRYPDGSTCVLGCIYDNAGQTYDPPSGACYVKVDSAYGKPFICLPYNGGTTTCASCPR